MDSSRFSLSEALSLLKPHIQYLPFYRLRDSMEINDWVCDRTLQFTIRPEHIKVPLGVELDSMVRVVYSKYKEVDKNKKIIRYKLLLEKKPDFSQGARWLFWESHFVPTVNGFGGKSNFNFVSNCSTVVAVTDDTFPHQVMSEDGFHTQCWDELRLWAQHSADQKAETSRSLAELASKCERLRVMVERHQALY